MSKLLKRQVKLHLPNLCEDDRARLHNFLEAVETAYIDAESDRKMLERSLDISSKEMAEKNSELVARMRVNDQAIESLKHAVNALAPNTFASSIEHQDAEEEVENLTSFLQKVISEHKNNIMSLQMEGARAQKLANELKLFKKAVEGAADFISIYDANYRLIYANKAMLERLGFDLRKARGRMITELWWSGMSGQAFEQFKADVLNTEKMANITFNIYDADRVEMPVRVLATPLLDSSGSPTHIINITHDISKEKELEEKKNEFVSIASHELRTPMTVIKSFAVILRDNKFGEINEKQRHYVDRIISNTTRLIALVSDMLDMSKLEAQKLSFAPSDVPLNQLIHDIVDGFMGMFDEKEVRLLYSKEGQVVAFADPSRVKQVINNLLSNALKFTPSQGLVTIKASKDLKDGNFVRVSIADTGVGISEQGKKALFTKFTQVDNVLQRQSEGTGLGLVICKQLVEAMGGRIWVESTPKKGSVFSFTIPGSKPNG